MANERYSSVWDAITDTREQATNMRLRAELMGRLTDKVEEWSITQRDAAARLGITQPRLNDMLNGRIHKFSLDALVNLLAQTTENRLHISVEAEESSDVLA